MPLGLEFGVQYPLINGHRYSFSSLRINIADIQITGIKSLNYKDSLKPTKMRGTDSVPLGETRGVYEASADIEIYRLEYEAVKARLAVGGRGFGENMFNIVAAYSEKNTPVVVDTIPACRIGENESSNSEGSEPSTIKLNLEVLGVILWNGLPLVTPIKIF